MGLSFEVWGRVRKPVTAVFNAVHDPGQLSRYFTTGGASGPLAAGTTVTWDFADFPGAFPVRVKSCVRNKRIVLSWASQTGGSNVVEFKFRKVGPRVTEVRIREGGWPDTPKGRKASYGNSMGWSHMLAALKAWCEYRINLRKGFYK
jgi:uncharacterized protein YndB with AHSA1/START domain